MYNIERIVENVKSEQVKVLKDPAIISKFLPLEFGVKVSKDTEDGKQVGIELVRAKSSYGNELARFANNEITYDLLKGTLSDSSTTYRAMYNLYANDKIQDPSSPIEELVYLKYSEQVYPSSINSYAKANREPNRSDFEAGTTKHESLNDFELGWRFGTPNVSVNSNVFYMNYQNQLI